ncbi:Myb-like DNA-binding domain containing protein [Tritrichomonas foetus]|uniref:Myb-like DNA-binding domain containing protein n=1 Tax=Tritrichomonas foetus TaxID=1144522 RepID=A0A1J4K4Z8_9EUKA|nr:Myb-like DNA-binding domain containing protein [Tritrichomonas foetus]|eukprot:OHT05936.1 Myb-like DNA-binding domain containing protein [Tritrichomonas foetus]
MNFQLHKLHPRRKFTPIEDSKLKDLVIKYGENSWQNIANEMEGRNMRQCRERWINYLSPTVDHTAWLENEDKRLDELYNEFGAKWVKIAKYFPGRTDINVKNRWMVLNRQKRKKERLLSKMGKNKVQPQINLQPVKKVNANSSFIQIYTIPINTADKKNDLKKDNNFNESDLMKTEEKSIFDAFDFENEYLDFDSQSFGDPNFWNDTFSITPLVLNHQIDLNI